MSFEYFLILSFFGLFGFFIQKYFQLKLFNSKKQMLIFYLFALVIGVIWDNFSVWRGHWVYPGSGITGVFIGLIPIEDYFFIVITAYFVLVLYNLIRKLIK